jgi:regulator of protease activity HflC (stomatin/prohibitin superfamily)
MTGRELVLRLEATAAEWLQRGRGQWLKLRENETARRLLVGGVLAAVVVTLAISSLVRIREGEVGVFVNNLTGSVAVEVQAGYSVVLPWMFSFYRLDRRVQSLSMTELGGGGFDAGDAVKIKTADGSNVSLDIQVTYRLLPERAAEVLKSAGPGMAFGQLWVRSAIRAMSAREFGKLTTEQIYDATLRNERAQAALAALNEELAGRGVEVVGVVPQDFRFYKDYEEIIKKKKLADQEVEEQQAQARLAVEERNKKVGEATHAGQAKVKTAEGEAERLRTEVDGYVQRVKLEAEGALATAEKKAEGTLAIGMSEAQGMAEAARAVNGPGGVNLVAVEYAKVLGKIAFTGVPVMQEGRQGQLRLTSVGAAACAGQDCGGGGGGGSAAGGAK